MSLLKTIREGAPLTWPQVAELALLHAVLFWASFHPLALFPLAWVAFVPLAVIVARGTRAQGYAGGFLAGFAGGGAAVFWLTLFGVGPWIGTALGFALYGVLIVALARPLARRLPAALWLPLAVVAEEYLRGHLFFIAFPWVFLGHSQYAIGPLLQAADLGGATLLSFLVAAGNGVVADALLGAGRRAVVRRGAAVAGVAAALMVYGGLRERSIEVMGGGPRTLAVQGNIPQDLKNEGRPDLLRIHRALTLDAAKGEKVDLVVWPETMVPVVWHYRDRPWPYDPRLPYAALDLDPNLRSWFKEIGEFTHGAHTIVGSIHAEAGTFELIEHNSAFFLGPDGRVIGRYDKMFPAPMSENTPFHDSWPAAHRFLRETFVPPGFSQFSPGRDVPIWDLGPPPSGGSGYPPKAGEPPRRGGDVMGGTRGGDVMGGIDVWKIGASVCFDITFPEATNLAVRNGADSIINVSNYGWFKDSAELDLARVQTIFRAIETRRGVVAVCNGGISSFVDPRGRAEDIERVDPVTGFRQRKLIEGTLIRPLTTSRAKTLFVFAGDWVGVGSSALAILLALGLRLVPRRRPAPAGAGGGGGGGRAEGTERTGR